MRLRDAASAVTIAIEQIYKDKIYMAAISRTVMNIKTGKMQEAYDFLDSKTQMISEIDGLIGFLIAQTGDNELTGMGVYESSEAAEAVTPIFMEVMGEMASLVDGQSGRGVYPGIWVS